MKKQLHNLLAGSLMLMYSFSIAQPTITATGTNPVIGNSFVYTVTNYFNQGSAGANQTWNFSTVTGTPNGASNCVSVASTPNGSSFPNANIAFNNTGSSNYSYQKTSATALQNYGSVSSTGIIMAYSNPEDYLHFPFTYNNTYTDPWAVNFVNGGYTFYRTGTTSITADGYGTLITPAGTFNNVLRVRMLQTYQDSAYFGTPYIIQYSNDEYMWYINGTHTAAAACFTFIANGSTSQSGFYLGTPMGVDNISNSLSSFNIFPNPASDRVKLGFTLTENKKVELSLFNSLGEKIQENQSTEGVQGANALELDVANLPKGIYFAQIILDGTVAATKRFIVSK